MIQAALIKGLSRLWTKAGQWVTFGWRLWRGIWLEAGMMEMGLLWREWWTAFDGEESSGKSGENGKRSLIQGLDLGGLEAVTFPWLTWVRQTSREGTRRATRKCWRGLGGELKLKSACQGLAFSETPPAQEQDGALTYDFTQAPRSRFLFNI